MIAILAIITRLRQACLHPTLILTNLQNKYATEKGLSQEDLKLEKLLRAHLAEKSDQTINVEDEDLSQTGLSPSKKRGPECSQCGEVTSIFNPPKTQTNLQQQPSKDRLELQCKHSGCRSCFLGTFEAQMNENEDVSRLAKCSDIAEKPYTQASCPVCDAAVDVNELQSFSSEAKNGKTTAGAADVVEISSSSDDDAIGRPFKSIPSQVYLRPDQTFKG